ncbi:hypothetical protein KBZ20_17485 [Vulcanococcus limneticus Candia 3F8]|uniref:hypothetical protein n=1 Tax=Vulcanococcus limneticus TaxID=2170428 RepID=UPI0012FFB287|nr:hypothetical protein [Vulcanococcus limneticus]MCP9895556.1 hypothetical protein [Vulcanococcus limneticus Candia 3F8]
MTDQELQSLQRSLSKLELYQKAELIRNAITRTFSEKSPHRISQLKELDELVGSMAETLPPCSASQLQSFENSIADAASLARRRKIIAELEAIAALLPEINLAIDRGISRWEQNARLQEEDEKRKLALAQALEEAKATVSIDVEQALENVAHQEGQDAITSGLIIEALLRIKGFCAAVSGNSPLRDRYLSEASRHINPPHLSLIEEAAGFFAMSNGVLIYMRHPASPPKSFFGLGQDFDFRPTGVLIRQISSDTFQAEHASRDRVEYGKQVDGRERLRVEPLPSADKAMAYIRSLGAKHWYTNFLHPNSPLSQAPRYPYPEEQHRVFIGWKDRAQNSSNP